MLKCSDKNVLAPILNKLSENLYNRATYSIIGTKVECIGLQRMIEGFEPHEFSDVLSRELSPARPIKDPNHLLGRQRKLTDVERAFGAAGRHVFIHGDRGVGKTSLALSAAVSYHTAKTDPINVSCDVKSTFRSIIGDILESHLSNGTNKALIDYVKVKLPMFEAGKEFKTIDAHTVPIDSVNDAARILDLIAAELGGKCVAVIDEFEQLKDAESKELFASLAKRLSDSDSAFKIIFCGIGTSVEDLLGRHLSVGRCIAPIELERMSSDALWEIIENACSAVNLKIDHETRTRIALLSDGFPYFVHLVTEHMLWAAYDSENPEDRIRVPHFQAGVSNAIKQSFVFLKTAYDRAVKKYNDDYEEVLWAIAERPTLSRQTTDIYEKSYLTIMNVQNMLLEDKKEILSIEKFRNRLNNLKTGRHGEIIAGTGAGWYQFRENMIRGYIRLRAHEKGIDLGTDHHLDQSEPKPV